MMTVTRKEIRWDFGDMKRCHIVTPFFTVEVIKMDRKVPKIYFDSCSCGRGVWRSGPGSDLGFFTFCGTCDKVFGWAITLDIEKKNAIETLEDYASYRGADPLTAVLIAAEIMELASTVH